jgi:hypothetical protein
MPDFVPRYYVLDVEGQPVPIDDVQLWGAWFETSAEVRRVAEDQIGPLWVSTVFLGLDHAWDDGPPLLFETMIFVGRSSQDVQQWRYSTREAAVQGHVAACQWARDHQRVARTHLEDR